MKLEYDLINGVETPSFKDVVRIVEPKEIDHFVVSSFSNNFEPKTITSRSTVNLKNSSNATDTLYFQFFDKDGNVVLPKFEMYQTSYAIWGNAMNPSCICTNKIEALYKGTKISALNNVGFDLQILIEGTGGFNIYINNTDTSINAVELNESA